MVKFLSKILGSKEEKIEEKKAEKALKKQIEIKKIYHSCFLITYPDETTVLTDPYFCKEKPSCYKFLEEPSIKKEDLPKIDVILISHEHFDHFEKDSVDYFCSKYKSIVVGPKEVTKQLTLSKQQERTVNVDDEIIVATIKIKTVTAQHHQSFYPIGFILEKDNTAIYFAGDTTNLPPINKKIDLALMPCGGIFTTDIFEFISMARQLKCNVAIPMHYNTFDLIKIDVNKLKDRAEEKLKNTKVVILKNDEIFTCNCND